MKQIEYDQSIFKADFFGNISVHIIQSAQVIFQEFHLPAADQTVVYRHDNTPQSALQMTLSLRLAHISR